MKPSITFIMSFIATLTAFSPYAVAKHVPSTQTAGTHCEFDKKDSPYLKQAIAKDGKQVYVPVAK